MTTETKVPSTTGGTFVSYRQDRTESGVHGQRSKTRKPAGGSAGFTLLELLVTVGVLAIIAGIAIPSFLSHRQNMFDNMAISDAQQLQMAMQARATRMDGRLTWQTGGMPSLVGNFSPTEGVEHRVFMNDMNQWCALSWHERGTLNSPDNPAWVASDSGGLRTGGPLNSEVCGELADFWDDITPPDPNNPSEPTDPSEVDTDGDGIPDEIEIELGLDPEVDQRLVMEFTTTGSARLTNGTEIPRSRTITLPAMNDADIWVDFGDGTPLRRFTGRSTVDNPWTHTFATDGTFTVTVHGTIPHIGTGSGTATAMTREQLAGLVRVPQWANTATTSASGAFFRAVGLTYVATPPSSIRNMSAMFREAESFDGAVAGWDTSNVTTMALMFMNAHSFSGTGISGWNTGSLTDTFEMFREARAFNQNLNTSGDTWDVSRVTRMDHMFNNARAFSGTLTGWNTGSAASMDQMFRTAVSFNRDLSCWDVRNISEVPVNFATGAHSGFTTDRQPHWGSAGCTPGVDTDGDGIPDHLEIEKGLDPTRDQRLVLEYITTGFVTPATVTNGVATNGTPIARSRTINLPVMTNANIWVDFGDGTPLRNFQGSSTRANPWTHTFASDGVFTVTVHGTIPTFTTNLDGNEFTEQQLVGLTRVTHWADTGTVVADRAFMNAIGLSYVARPPATVARMVRMMQNTVSFDGDVTGWVHSGVQHIGGMFWNATRFTGRGVPTWQTNNIANMDLVFRNAVVFNQNLNTSGNVWNVSNAVNFHQLFDGAAQFNGTLNGWNTARAERMDAMFRDTVFNRPVNHLNTANVTRMNSMFQRNTAFSQDNVVTSGSNWNTARVTTMNSMFDGASNFNGDVRTWNTGAVTDMTAMFRGATRFNRGISGWNTANATTMESMFQNASAFNQPLNGWNVSRVTNRANFANGANSGFTVARQPQWVN